MGRQWQSWLHSIRCCLRMAGRTSWRFTSVEGIAFGFGGAGTLYSYAPDNKRVWRRERNPQHSTWLHSGA